MKDIPRLVSPQRAGLAVNGLPNTVRASYWFICAGFTTGTFEGVLRRKRSRSVVAQELIEILLTMGKKAIERR